MYCCTAVLLLCGRAVPRTCLMPLIASHRNGVQHAMRVSKACRYVGFAAGQHLQATTALCSKASTQTTAAACLQPPKTTTGHA
ncbi:hypothetical protein COO60DRAFT_1491119 [Scenedesmus sp. NREL 46B-D3]|nr:hypothetical protein COO60DRAFT_1491119 [Scenedesmus sp. NREL 46B-D3]